MTNLTFPNNYLDHKYSQIHFSFFLQYAELAQININYIDESDTVFIGQQNKLLFSCLINGKQVIIDYSDNQKHDWINDYKDIIYFKFQKTQFSSTKAIPLGPPIVCIKNQNIKNENILSYFQYKNKFNYNPGKKVLCKQLPNGSATDRRNYVHGLMSKNLKEYDIDYHDNQLTFWDKHQDGCISVCVPGFSNNIIDRGQMELFGLGVCTISPKLDTQLSYNTLAIPGIHYIQCKDDYSNLISIIHMLQKNYEYAKTVGNNAQILFNKCYTPVRYWKWITQNL